MRDHGIRFDLPEYVLMDKLGEGSYGIVRKGKDPNTGAQVVMKMFKTGFEPDVIREIALLARTKAHPSIVPLLGVRYAKRRDPPPSSSDDGKHPPVDFPRLNLCAPEVVQTLYVSDLHQSLHRSWNHFQLPETFSTRVYEQLESGLAHLHKHGFMHRDLKPANIFCNRRMLQDGPPEELQVVIGDYGLAGRYIPGRANTLEVQTLFWRAPEVLLGDEYYTPRADLWSLGLIYLQLILGHDNLFKGDRTEYGQLLMALQLWGVLDVDNNSLTKLPRWNPRFSQFRRNEVVQKELENFYEASVAQQMLRRLECTLALDPAKRSFSGNDVPPSVAEAGFSPPPQGDDVTRIWNDAPKLTLRYRAIVCDWLMDVIRTHSNNETTDENVRLAQATIDFLDRFLGRRGDLEREHLQIAGTACLSIASQLYDRDPMDRGILVSQYFADDDNALQKWECHICRVLEFDLYVPQLPDALRERARDDNGPHRRLPGAELLALLDIAVHHPDLMRTPRDAATEARRRTETALKDRHMPWTPFPSAEVINDEDENRGTRTALAEWWNAVVESVPPPSRSPARARSRSPARARSRSPTRPPQPSPSQTVA